MMASAPRIIVESGQHQHSPVPFPSLLTNPSQLDAKHTPNPFTPHALAIPSHRMPFPSLHTACPPCTRIMTNLLEKTTQKWRISKRWRSTREDLASAAVAAFDLEVCPDMPPDACRWMDAAARRCAAAAAPAGSCLADAWQGHGRRRGRSWTESLVPEPRLYTTKARV